MYIRTSNCITQSVLWQYLNVCFTTGFQPKIVCSDRGKETLLCTEVYYAFACIIQDNPNFKLRDC